MSCPHIARRFRCTGFLRASDLRPGLSPLVKRLSVKFELKMYSRGKTDEDSNLCSYCCSDHRSAGLLISTDLQNCRGCRCGWCCGGSGRRSHRRSNRSRRWRRCWRCNRGCSFGPRRRAASLTSPSCRRATDARRSLAFSCKPRNGSYRTLGATGLRWREGNPGFAY